MFRTTYFFYKRLRNAIVNFYREIKKPETFIKGEEFEFFLRRKIYTQDKYELVMRTHSYNDNKGDYIEFTKYPDFLFREVATGAEFFVEAKYREKLFKEKVEWCNNHQFLRYKEIHNNRKVIIAIGLGGRPRHPKRLFIIPLEHIQYSALYPSRMLPFEQTIPSKSLLEKVKDMIYG